LPTPQTRAGWAKYVVGFIKRRPDAQQREIFEALGSVRDEIRDAGMMGWIPAELHMILCNSILQALRENLAVDFWSDLCLKAFKTPVLRPFILSASTIYGGGARGYLRLAPIVYGRVTKACGTLSVQSPTDSWTRIRVDGLPAVLRCNPAMAVSLAGTCWACIRHAGAKGTVETDMDQLAIGRVVFDIRYSN
jgi:hypothetical protein